jgi:hypothetical protein
MLSRPVTTVSLILSTWLAVSIAAFLTHVAFVSASWLQAHLIVPSIVTPADFATKLISSFFLCFSMSAVVILLSSLVSGVRDLGILAGIFVATFLLQLSDSIPFKDIQNGFLREAASTIAFVFSHLSAGLNYFVMPRLEVHLNVVPQADLVLSLLSITAVTCAALSLAIARLNTMELSYATE